MGKGYEKYSAQVKGFNSIFMDTIKKKGEEINGKMSDWRLSPKGKEDAVNGIIKEMWAICDNMNKVFYEAVNNFCKEYSLTLPNDGKDHSTDIQNAFRVIEMLGFNIDRNNLNNIIEPLKGNYKALKTVLDVMRVRNESGLSGLNPSNNHYSGEIMQIVNEYSGIYTNVSDFLMIMEDIKAIPENPAGYRFEASQVSNSPLITVSEVIPYSHMACSDWMIEAGKSYEMLNGEFNSLYNSAPATDTETMNSVLQG